MSDSEFNPPKKNVQDWREQADKQLNRAGKTVDDLITQTPEGIDLNPLYTADDLAGYPRAAGDDVCGSPMDDSTIRRIFYR